MVDLATTVQLLGSALGCLGGALVFIEFFQLPTYVEYDENLQGYTLDISPDEMREHTWLGRIGGLCVSLGFALLFVAEFL